MLNPDQLVAKVVDLVSLPEVVIEISRLIDDPRTSAEDIGRVIARDPGLAARLLGIANSASFGMSQRVETIPRAVTLLGTSQIRELALGLTAARTFSGIPNTLVSPASFWHHSLLAGVCARSVAIRCAPHRAEHAFVAGLLHDIGQLVMFSQAPAESYRALLLSIDLPGEPELWHCEREVFGYDHARVGAALARRWLLPPALRECIEFHHEPSSAVEYPIEVAITHIANAMANLVETETTEIEDVPVIDSKSLALAGIAIPEILELCQTTGPAIAEARGIFGLPEYPPPGV